MEGDPVLHQRILQSLGLGEGGNPLNLPEPPLEGLLKCVDVVTLPGRLHLRGDGNQETRMVLREASRSSGEDGMAVWVLHSFG